MDVAMSQTTQVFSNVVFCFELKKNRYYIYHTKYNDDLTQIIINTFYIVNSFKTVNLVWSRLEKKTNLIYTCILSF